MVADYFNNRVQVFSLGGDFITQWGTGSPVSFLKPEKIDQDSIGNYYIADTDHGRIVKLSESGTFITEWGGFWPRGVGVGPDNSVFVADWGGAVLKFTLDGLPVTGWADNGRIFVGGSLEAVRTDSAGNLYVVSGNEVVKLDPDGVLISSWGGYGSDPGQLRPI